MATKKEEQLIKVAKRVEARLQVLEEHVHRITETRVRKMEVILEKISRVIQTARPGNVGRD